MDKEKTINKPMYDRRVKEILAELDKGRSRADIADDYNYSDYRSLHMYMIRKNFYFDGESYIPEIERRDLDIKEELARDIPVKAERIIKKISEGSDIKTLAEDEGFENHNDMGQYMKDNNLVWSTDSNNYIYDVVEALVADDDPEDLEDKNKIGGADHIDNKAGKNIDADNRGLIDEKYMDLLELLYKKKDKLISILNSDSNSLTVGEIPKYLVPGVPKTKSIFMSNLLSRLITDFSETKNISQREIVESAIIEYLSRYGYEDEVEMLLNRR